MLATPNTLAATLLPRTATHVAGAVLAAIVGALLLTLSAKVQVPFYPVPMTMQSFVVLGLGAALGARLGAASVALYLAQGALGLPVFAGTPEKDIGRAYMMGPTGGYLAGFLLAAYVIGLLAERGWDRSHLKLFAAMALGHAIIFLAGYVWLAGLIGWEKAWLSGVLPFGWATLFKTALAAALLPAIWRVIGSRPRSA